MVPPITRSPASFLYRNRLARHHRFVNRAGAFYHNSIHRDLLAGTHAEEVARLYLIQRYILFCLIGTRYVARFLGQGQGAP